MEKKNPLQSIFARVDASRSSSGRTKGACPCPWCVSVLEWLHLFHVLCIDTLSEICRLSVMIVLLPIVGIEDLILSNVRSHALHAGLHLIGSSCGAHLSLSPSPSK